MCRWFGVSTTLHNDKVSHFNQFQDLMGRGKVLSHRVVVVWFACVWNIWKTRNRKLFRSKEICLEEMLEEIKVTPWNWLSINSNNLS